MLTLTITDEQLQTSFDASLSNMLSPGNYLNPVKSLLDKMLGYSGHLHGEIGKQITAFLETQLTTPEFQAMLGKSIADELARRACDSIKEKDNR